MKAILIWTTLAGLGFHFIVFTGIPVEPFRRAARVESNDLSYIGELRHQKFLEEKAFLYDPEPLFLPTRVNYSIEISSEDAIYENLDAFTPYPAHLILPEIANNADIELDMGQQISRLGVLKPESILSSALPHMGATFAAQREQEAPEVSLKLNVELMNMTSAQTLKFQLDVSESMQSLLADLTQRWVYLFAIEDYLVSEFLRKEGQVDAAIEQGIKRELVKQIQLLKLASGYYQLTLNF